MSYSAEKTTSSSVSSLPWGSMSISITSDDDLRRPIGNFSVIIPDHDAALLRPPGPTPSVDATDWRGGVISTTKP